MPLPRGIFNRLPLPYVILTERVTFQVYNGTADGQGGLTDSWTNLTNGVNVPAIVSDDKSRKRNLGGQEMQLGVNAEHITHHIYLRYDIPGLVPGCRAMWDGIYMRVHNVDHFGGNPLVLCEEIRG